MAASMTPNLVMGQESCWRLRLPSSQSGNRDCCSCKWTSSTLPHCCWWSGDRGHVITPLSSLQGMTFRMEAHAHPQIGQHSHVCCSQAPSRPSGVPWTSPTSSSTATHSRVRTPHIMIIKIFTVRSNLNVRFLGEGPDRVTPSLG